MTHRKKGKILSRSASAKSALMRSLVTNLVLYERIRTTLSKAQELQPLIERYVSLSKNNDLSTRRQLLKFLYAENAVKKMLEVLGPKYKDVKGGYTKVTKLGFRKGDGAPLVQIEFV